MQVSARVCVYVCVYLGVVLVRLGGQDAEVSRGGDGQQAFDILEELLVVLGVPEDHAVLLPLRLGVGVHHSAGAVPPLREREREIEQVRVRI